MKKDQEFALRSVRNPSGNTEQGVGYEAGFEGGAWAGGGHLDVFRMNMTFGAVRENGVTQGVSADRKEKGLKDHAPEHAKFKKLEHGAETSGGN